MAPPLPAARTIRSGATSLRWACPARGLLPVGATQSSSGAMPPPSPAAGTFVGWNDLPALVPDLTYAQVAAPWMPRSLPFERWHRPDQGPAAARCARQGRSEALRALTAFCEHGVRKLAARVEELFDELAKDSESEVR